MQRRASFRRVFDCVEPGGGNVVCREDGLDMRSPVGAFLQINIDDLVEVVHMDMDKREYKTYVFTKIYICSGFVERNLGNMI